ncbi:MAG: helix-turn-helix transcriptional regulator [Candidatus Hodarchaeales archaeon]
MINPDTETVESTRGKILRYLLHHRSEDDKRRTVENIAAALDVTPNAIRQHLKLLVSEELIIQTMRKSKTGRPARLYSLHENAFEFFPKTYPDFSVKLIQELKKKYGNQQAYDLLNDVWDSMVSEMIEETQVEGDDEKYDTEVGRRLEFVTKFFRVYGKFPELIEDDDSFAFKNYNCLLFNIAKVDPLICKIDKSLMEKLVGQTARKEKCIRDGDPYCLYRFKK